MVCLEMMNPTGLPYINVEALFLEPWELQRLLFLEELLLNRPAKPTITLSQALTSRSLGSWSSSIGAIAHPCSRNSTHVEMQEAPLQSFASSDPAQMTAVYINMYTSRSKAPFTLRQMILIQQLISIRYHYLSTMWFGVARRTDTQKDMCLKEIEFHVQNIITNLGSLVNIIRRDQYDHFVSSKIMRKVTAAFIWIC